MLPEPFMDHELPCTLMVNGIAVQSVHIRCVSDLSDGFQVSFDDPRIGLICLHETFRRRLRLVRQSVQGHQQMEGASPAPTIRLKVSVQREDVSCVQLIGQLHQAGIREVHG